MECYRFLLNDTLQPYHQNINTGQHCIPRNINACCYYSVCAWQRKRSCSTSIHHPDLHTLTFASLQDHYFLHCSWTFPKSAQVSAHSGPTRAPEGPVSPIFQVQHSVQSFEHTAQTTESEFIKRNRHKREKNNGTVSIQKTASSLALEKLYNIGWVVRLKLFISIVLHPLICSFLWASCLLFIRLYIISSQHALKCVS